MNNQTKHIDNEILVAYAEGNLDERLVNDVEALLEESEEARRTLDEIKETIGLVEETSQIMMNTESVPKEAKDDFLNLIAKKKSQETPPSATYTTSEFLSWLYSNFMKPVAFASVILIIGFGIGRLTVPEPEVLWKAMPKDIENLQRALKLTSEPAVDSFGGPEIESLSASGNALTSERFKIALMDILESRKYEEVPAKISSGDDTYTVTLLGRHVSGDKKQCHVGEITTKKEGYATFKNFFLWCKNSENVWENLIITE